MNSEYQQLAYERTIISTVRRHIEDKYLGANGAAAEELICEDVPYQARMVPRDMFVEFIQRLSEEESRITTEMSAYDFRKRDAKPFPPSTKVQDAPAKEPTSVPAKGPSGKGRKPRVGASGSR